MAEAESSVPPNSSRTPLAGVRLLCSLPASVRSAHATFVTPLRFTPQEPALFIPIFTLSPLWVAWAICTSRSRLLAPALILNSRVLPSSMVMVKVRRSLSPLPSAMPPAAFNLSSFRLPLPTPTQVEGGV